MHFALQTHPHPHTHTQIHQEWTVSSLLHRANFVPRTSVSSTSRPTSFRQESLDINNLSLIILALAAETLLSAARGSWAQESYTRASNFTSWPIVKVFGVAKPWRRTRRHITGTSWNQAHSIRNSRSTLQKSAPRFGIMSSTIEIDNTDKGSGYGAVMRTSSNDAKTNHTSKYPEERRLDSNGLPLVPQPSIFKDDPLVSTLPRIILQRSLPASLTSHRTGPHGSNGRSWFRSASWPS